MSPRFAALALLLLSALGCQSTRGPFAPKPSRPDDPFLPIQEQEARGRNRYPLFEDNGDTGPKTFFRYGPTASRN
jgi:hypothetical protein